MGLLKLKTNLTANEWAQQKAVDILNSIPSQDLILEAYLFGSAVEGVFTDDSDLDFVVVTNNEAAINQIKKEVYSPRFANIAIDWIFKTKKSFDERKNFGGVCFDAFHYGKKIR
jgi:predicted nucleotidyltransferase